MSSSGKALWIRVEAHAVSSVEIARIADKIGMKPPAAFGHVIALAGNVGEHVPDGRISDVPDATLERWAQWEGKRGRFAAAVRAHLQDPWTGEFWNWRETMGKLIERRAADRQRKAQPSAEFPRNEEGTSAENRRVSAATERNGTERNVVTPTSNPSVSDNPPRHDLPEAAGIFLREFYSDANPTRQADVLDQLRATRTRAGAKVQASDRARAVDDLHFSRSLAKIIRGRRPKNPDVAINWALKEIAASRLEYMSEQVARPGREREGGIAHVSEAIEAAGRAT